MSVFAHDVLLTWPRKQLNIRITFFKIIDYFSTVVCVLVVHWFKYFISTVQVLTFNVVCNLPTVVFEFSIQVACKVRRDLWVLTLGILGHQKPNVQDFSGIGLKLNCEERNRSDFFNFTYDEYWDWFSWEIPKLYFFEMSQCVL